MFINSQFYKLYFDVKFRYLWLNRVVARGLKTPINGESGYPQNIKDLAYLSKTIFLRKKDESKTSKEDKSVSFSLFKHPILNTVKRREEETRI